MIRILFNNMYSYSQKKKKDNSTSSSSIYTSKPLFPINNAPTSSTQFPIYETPTSSTHISSVNAHGWYPSRSFIRDNSNLLFFSKQSLSALSKQSSLREQKFTERGLRDIESEGQRKEPFLLQKKLSIKMDIPHFTSCPSNPTYGNPNMTCEKLKVLFSSLAIPLALK